MNRQTNDSKRYQDHCGIILVNSQNSGNIGSVARVMVNMGIKELILVTPSCDPFSSESLRMARDGEQVLKECSQVETLEEALSEFHYAVGTTARQGERRGPFRSPRQLASELKPRAAQENIAFVFGPEDRGLSAKHLSLCQQVLTIPTAAFKSLNLAQAVMIVAYELWIADSSQPTKSLSHRLPLGEQEPLFQELQAVLLDIGYLNEQNPDHIMLDLRRMFTRGGITKRELRILRGILRQVRWATDNPKIDVQTPRFSNEENISE